jgi:hypothetical protein
VQNEDIMQSYPLHKWIRVVCTKDIELITVSSLVSQGIIPPPDFVRIDIQGLECEAFLGFESYLNQFTGVGLDATLNQFAKNRNYYGRLLIF